MGMVKMEQPTGKDITLIGRGDISCIHVSRLSTFHGAIFDYTYEVIFGLIWVTILLGILLTDTEQYFWMLFLLLKC